MWYMTLSEVVRVRARPEHVTALDVFCEAHNVGRSTAIRILIEAWARSIQNVHLLDAVPDELHAQVPDLWSTLIAAPLRFDIEAWAESARVLDGLGQVEDDDDE